MRRHPVSRLVALCLPLGIVLAGCGGDGGDPAPTPTPVPVPAIETAAPAQPSDPSPAEPTTPAPTTSETSEDDTAAEETLDHYLVRDGGGRLWVEPVPFTYDPAATGGAVAREALTRWLEAEDTDGLVDPVPDGTSLVDVDLDGTLLTVDLSADVTANPGLGAEGEEAFAQALAHTGGQFATVDAVQLLVEGQPVTELWGHLDWSEPIEPDPFAISPIVVGSATGADGTITLSGTSNTFEATIDVVVTSSSGEVVREDFITATCGTGCRGDWTYELEDLEPGDYEITLTEPDPSGGEGPPPFEVTTEVTVPA